MSSSSTSKPKLSFRNPHASKYDLAINPPYMINYRAKRCGKTITASKRRVTFQFGFSSADAIRQGKIEADARGEEHEIVLVWSHITGKRQLFMDGSEFHASKAARGNTKFEHSWGIPGNHVLKIVANGAPPLSASCTAEGSRQFRQFDLELDGMSYFDFAKIYELGTMSATPNAQKVEGDRFSNSLPALTYSYRGSAYDARDDELEEESRQPPQSLLKVNTFVDLFDTQLVVSQSTVTPMSMSNQTTPTSSISVPLPNGCNTGFSINSDSFSSSHYCDEFAPVAPTGKSFDTIYNDILSAYLQAPPALAPVIDATSCTALVCTSEHQMDKAMLGMKNLVNLDDITHTPSLEHASARRMKAAPSQPVGRSPTLAEMHCTHQESPTVATRPVFNKFQSQQALVPLPYGQQLQAPMYNGYGNQVPAQSPYGQQIPEYGYGNQQSPSYSQSQYMY